MMCQLDIVKAKPWIEKSLEPTFTPRSGRERCVTRENPPDSPDGNRIQLFCRARYRHAPKSQISPRLSRLLFVSLPQRHRSHSRLAARYHIAQRRTLWRLSCPARSERHQPWKCHGRNDSEAGITPGACPCDPLRRGSANSCPNYTLPSIDPRSSRKSREAYNRISCRVQMQFGRYRSVTVG